MSFDGSTSKDTVQAMYLDGRRKWPDIHVEFSVFSAHCARLSDLANIATPPASSRAPELDSRAGRIALEGRAPLPAAGARLDDIAIYGADIYLSCACACGNVRALQDLEALSSTLVRSAVSRVKRDSDFVAETLQVFWERLLRGHRPRIGKYSGRGPLLAWLRVVATRTALDCLRQGSHATEQLPEGLFFEAAHSAESEITRSRYAEVFQRALAEAVAGLTRRERSVLYLHLNSQCSLEQIGRVYGVHRATVSRWLDAARSQVFRAIRQALTKDGELSESEFRSIARVIQPDLELIVPTASLSSDAGDEQRG